MRVLIFLLDVSRLCLGNIEAFQLFGEARMELKHKPGPDFIKLVLNRLS